jgi:hypothetical protein
MTDTVLRSAGYKCLVREFGRVGAERFIALIIAEPFDYTKWSENLYEDMSLRDLHDKAAELRINQRAAAKA